MEAVRETFQNGNSFVKQDLKKNCRIFFVGSFIRNPEVTIVKLP
jgi:hypothetical protein